jgi:cyclopropane fatty-acyl-phospholipid synthase-like methyltransferase
MTYRPGCRAWQSGPFDGLGNTMNQPLIPARVGLMYDRLTAISHDVLGDNFHLGYWDNPRANEPPDSIEAATRRLTAVLITMLAPQEGDTVLDIGSGLGAPAIALAQRRDTVVRGITVSADQVRAANRAAHAAAASDRVTFQYGDATEPAFPPDTFDAAWAIESLCHLPTRDRALAGTARVLKPGGRLLVADVMLTAPVPAARRQRLEDYTERFMMTTPPTPQQYRSELENAGFCITQHHNLTPHVLTRSFIEIGHHIAQHRADLEQRHGPELVSRFDLTHLSALRELGYHVIVAERRPTTPKVPATPSATDK